MKNLRHPALAVVAAFARHAVAISSDATLPDRGLNGGKGRPSGAEDVRCATKGDRVDAFLPGTTPAALHFESLGTAAHLQRGKITSATPLGGSEPLRRSQAADALTIEVPPGPLSDIVTVFEISTR